MSNVLLVNRTKRPPRMLVLNLTKMIAAVKVENRTTQESRDGVRRKRIDTKLVPDSIRIPSGGEVVVDAKVLGAPEVAAAIARRDLLVKEAPPEAPEEEASDDEAEG